MKFSNKTNKIFLILIENSESSKNFELGIHLL